MDEMQQQKQEESNSLTIQQLLMENANEESFFRYQINNMDATSTLLSIEKTAKFDEYLHLDDSYDVNHVDTISTIIDHDMSRNMCIATGVIGNHDSTREVVFLNYY